MLPALVDLVGATGELASGLDVEALSALGVLLMYSALEVST